MYELYNVAFYALLLCLGWWYARRQSGSEGQLPGRLTLLALLILTGSWLGLDGTLSWKFSVAFRDLLLLAGAGMVLGIGIGIGRKVPVWVAVILLVLGLAWVLRDQLEIGRAVAAAAPDREAIVITLDPDGEYLVELANGRTEEELQQWAAMSGSVSIERAFYPADGESTELDDYYLLNFTDDLTGEQRLERLQRNSLFDWVEGNEIVTVDLPDLHKKLPDLNIRLGVNDPDVEQQWAMEALEMDRYYRALAERKPVRRALIAILDTGVDSGHEDLAGNYRSLNSRHDSDQMGHGTHCAGIAAAVTNNGLGVASMAPTGAFVEVAGVKVLSRSGMGTQKSIIAGIIEAADAGADVISMSLGGASNQAKQRAYSQAVAYALEKGSIVVAAAGNANRNASGFSPVNAEGVIGVSAIDQHGLRAPFSNIVTDIPMAVAAPGVGIYSTTPGSRYKAFSGTSMATPQVSGLIAVMRSLRPDLTAAEAFQILHDTGRELSDGDRTGRLIRPARAIEAL